MAKFISVPCLKSKAAYAGGALFFTAPLANFLDTELKGGFFWLLAVMALFWHMLREDAEQGTVDLRCILLLSAGLFLCSIHPAVIYWFSFLAYLILFRMLYVVSSLLEMGKNWCLCHKQGISKESMSFDKRIPIPFLPCFGGGLFVLILAASFSSDILKPIWSLNDLLTLCIGLLTNRQMLVILGGLLLVLGVFELIWGYAKKYQKSVVCIGMGDVLVLPSFAAFLGGSFFLLVLGCAWLLASGFAWYQKYYHQEVS